MSGLSYTSIGAVQLMPSLRPPVQSEPPLPALPPLDDTNADLLLLPPLAFPSDFPPFPPGPDNDFRDFPLFPPETDVFTSSLAPYQKCVEGFQLSMEETSFVLDVN